jgi:superfamily II DNA helicase RecQ
VYCVAQFDKASDARKSLKKHLEIYKADLLLGEGIMIQCRWVNEVKAWVEELGIPAYWSGAADRAQIVADWLSGKHPVIACTSGLGTRVHHPACWVVFHWGLRFGLMGYFQECGRTARNGLPSLCILFHFHNPHPNRL